jgi:hypothetical protein
MMGREGGWIGIDRVVASRSPTASFFVYACNTLPPFSASLATRSSTGFSREERVLCIAKRVVGKSYTVFHFYNNQYQTVTSIIQDERRKAMRTGFSKIMI